MLDTDRLRSVSDASSASIIPRLVHSTSEPADAAASENQKQTLVRETLELLRISTDTTYKQETTKTVVILYVYNLEIIYT